MFNNLIIFNTRLRAAAMAGLICAVFAPAARAQDSDAEKIAAMSQDIEQLSRQVSQLQLQVENLSQNNADLQRQMVSPKDVQAMVQNAVAASRGDTHSDITQANSELRKEIVDEVAKQIDALTKETNRQLDALAKAIQATPPAASSGSGAAGTTAAGVTTTFSDDYPKTGVSYVVQPGDSLGRIARKNGSTVRDIENANHISDPKSLVVGKTIFIPQKTPTTPSPAASPTPAPAATK
jgi:LysM repeat protein